MAELTLRSLPHDIIWCILRNIDDIPDFESFCTALPNTTGVLTQQWTSLYDRLYWKEIDEHHFPQLVLLDLIFNGDDVVAEMLQPQTRLRYYRNGLAIATAVAGSPLNKKNRDARLHRSIRKSLDPETKSRMKGIHIQIERMAEIFMNYQLEQHHPTPEFYRQPTSEERRRVIAAVYNAWAIGLNALQEATNTDPSLRIYKLGSGIADLYVNLYDSLASTWTFWDVKEARAMFNVLWREIPQNMAKRFSSRPGIEDGDNVMHFLDFLFSDHEWSPETYLKLFDRQGNQETTADEEMLKYLRQYRAAVMGFSVGPPASSTSRLLLERLDLSQRLRRPFLLKFDQKLESHERSNGLCGPPELRRLVLKSIPLSSDDLMILRFKGQGDLLTSWNWTRASNFMMNDCMWEDWRLEGWGYQFPQVEDQKDGYESHQLVPRRRNP